MYVYERAPPLLQLAEQEVVSVMEAGAHVGLNVYTCVSFTCPLVTFDIKVRAAAANVRRADSNSCHVRRAAAADVDHQSLIGENSCSAISFFLSLSPPSNII